VETLDILRNVDLFKYMDDEGLGHVATRVQLVSLPTGPIIRDNEPADGLYIVKSGKAGVTKAGANQRAEVMLATLGEGKSFGEIGLLDGLPRSANVTAIVPTECYFLGRESFSDLLDQHPELARGMLVALAGMVRNADMMVGKLLCI